MNLVPADSADKAASIISFFSGNPTDFTDLINEGFSLAPKPEGPIGMSQLDARG